MKNEQYELPMLIGVGVVLAAALLVGCGQVQETAGPTAVRVVPGDGSARVSLSSVLDERMPNSCDVSSFRTHQQEGPAGTTKQTFEMVPGDGLTAWDVEYQRWPNRPGQRADDWTGAVTQRASDARAIVEVLLSESGHYRGRMKGRLCARWSAWEEFSIAGDEPTDPVEDAPACLQSKYWPGCVPGVE